MNVTELCYGLMKYIAIYLGKNDVLIERKWSVCHLGKNGAGNDYVSVSPALVMEGETWLVYLKFTECCLCFKGEIMYLTWMI